MLQLKLEDKGGINPQVLTQKPVFFRREGGTSWKRLEIIHAEGSQMVEIGHRVAIN
ncbi:hypothetical protein D3C78_1780400 [compost metagenome]